MKSSTEEKQAIVVATNETVKVFAIKNPVNGKKWCNYMTPTITYTDTELKFK